MSLVFAINAGEFNKPIIINSNEIHKDEYNIIHEIKTELIKTRAKVTNVKSGESNISDGVAGIEELKFFIRFVRSIDVNLRCEVVYKGKTYKITSINNIKQADKYLEIIAKEVI